MFYFEAVSRKVFYRLLVKMDDGEQTVVTRRYVKPLKRYLLG